MHSNTFADYVVCVCACLCNNKYFVRTVPQREWRLAHPKASGMCSGNWFFNNTLSKQRYAYKPLDGKTPTGGHTAGVAISQEDASISVAWCADQMKDDKECSQQFVGVANNNGHCWCAKKGGDCTHNDGLKTYILTGGHFFELRLPGCGTHVYAKRVSPSPLGHSFLLISLRQLPNQGLLHNCSQSFNQHYSQSFNQHYLPCQLFPYPLNHHVVGAFSLTHSRSHANYVSLYAEPQREWRLAHPKASGMCSGNWFYSNTLLTHMYAYKPLDGKTPTGGHTTGVAISQEDASISVAWCADQMKDDKECSQQFVGVANNNGHCWCAKKGGDCSNFDIKTYILSGGHFFELRLPGCETQMYNLTFVQSIFDLAVSVTDSVIFFVTCMPAW